MKLPYRRKMYTTGDIAGMLDVTRPTVRHWCDSGMLRTHKIAGSSHRRIRHRDLVSFFREHKMYTLLDLLTQPSRTVLLIGCNPALPAQLAEELGEDWTVRAVGSHFEAGEYVARVVPAFAVMDTADLEKARELALTLQHHFGMVLVGLSYDDQPQRFKEEHPSPFHKHLPHWSTPKSIAAVIEAAAAV